MSLIPPGGVVPPGSHVVELGVFFLAGVLGGAHCLGMCGPLVTLYTQKMTRSERGLSWAGIGRQLLFNLGRTAGYAAAGAVLGAIGMWTYDFSRLVFATELLRGTVGLTVGAFILLTGTGYLLYGSARGVWKPLVATPVGVAYSQLHRRVDGWVQDKRILLLGSLHALLPCPILYPAYLYVLARGRPAAGAGALAALGLGTLPTLLAYGVAFGSVEIGGRRWLHRVLGGVFLVLGYLSVSMGARSFGLDLPVIMPPYLSPLNGTLHP